MSGFAKRAKVANLDAIHDTVHEMARDNVHHVTPHERLLPDGTTIWVDGDTSVDTFDGWVQSNPDYKA